MTEKKWDIAVIGAGPGGYVAAIKAAQLGRTVALIDQGPIGGTCLNVGCIPTKTLLANAQVLHTIAHADAFGITTGSVSFDFAKMKERKDAVVDRIRKSLEGLLLSNKITLLRGHASFLSPREIKVQGQDACVLLADRCIIASGSEPLDVPTFPCDHQRIFNSTSILELTSLPQKIAIIGGGYIGCEFASLYAELGSSVTILEALPSLVAAQGRAISDALTRSFEERGIDVRTNVLVEGIDRTGEMLSIRLREHPALSCDIVLVAVGRRIVTDTLGLERVALLPSDKGAIAVDDRMQTATAGLYAVGDVTGKALLAHVASHQGLVAAINACGGEARMHYHAVPAVIFTSPEIATVGLTPEQAQAEGRRTVVGKFPFQALGKSIASMDVEGFVQVLSDQTTGQILGAQAIGHEASTLIAEMALAISNELTIDCVTDTIHAHPTIAEAWLEAAFIAKGAPLHFPPRRK